MKDAKEKNILIVFEGNSLALFVKPSHNSWENLEPSVWKFKIAIPYLTANLYSSNLFWSKKLSPGYIFLVTHRILRTSSITLNLLASNF